MNQSISATYGFFIIPIIILKASGMPIPLYPLLNEKLLWYIEKSTQCLKYKITQLPFLWPNHQATLWFDCGLLCSFAKEKDEHS